MRQDSLAARAGVAADQALDVDGGPGGDVLERQVIRPAL